MHADSIRRTLIAFAAATVVACAGRPTGPGGSSGNATTATDTGSTVSLRPADAARPSLGVIVTIASPEALAAELDAFARDAGLPLPLGQGALELLVKELPGMRLSREQLSRLAPTESMALVTLFARPGTPEGLCAALAFKDAALAQKTLDELGPEYKRQEGVSARKVSLEGDSSERKVSGDVWTAVTGRTVLIANSPDVLLAGGALALEAQRAPREGQVVVTLHPQAMTERGGLPAIIDDAAKSLDEDLSKHLPGTKGKPITPAMRRLIVAGFKVLARPVADARSVRLAARLDGKSGFLLQVDVEPQKPGSATHPFTVDAALPILDDRTAVFAMGEHPAAVDAMVAAFGATGPAGKSMAKELETFLNSVVAGGSCAVSFMPPPMTGICAYPLRSGVTSKRALDGYAAVLNGAQPWNNEVLGPGGSKTKIKRSKDLIEIETTKLETDPTSRAVRLTLLGGDTARNAVAVRDGRLFQAQGPNPRELLQSIGTQKSDVAKAPILAAMLERNKGAEGFFYFDVISVFSATTKGAQDPVAKQLAAMMGAVPGLSDLRAPLVVTLRGGATTGLDLQLPFQSLQNAARVVRPFVGRMGAAP